MDTKEKLPEKPKSPQVGDLAQFPESDFDVTLIEFCTRLSAVDKRVELISAFHHSENQSGRVKDTDANYRTRYEALISQPA